MTDYGRDSRIIHYVALNRGNNEIVIRLTKREICDWLGVSTYILNKNLNGNTSYHCEEYSVWCDETVPIVRRGFAKKTLLKKYN